MLEGLRELFDDGKGQKRRGKEEDSDITGADVLEIWHFFEKTGEVQGNLQKRSSIELISVHSVF